MFNRQESDATTSKPIRWIDKITSFFFQNRPHSFFNTTYLNQFFNDKDAASFNYLLTKTPLSTYEVRRLASSAISQAKPKILNILATHYPDVITDEFVQDGLQNCSTSKELMYALATFRNNDMLAPSLQRYFTDETDDKQLACRDMSNIGIFAGSELDRMQRFVRNNQRCGKNQYHFFFHGDFQYDPVAMTHAILARSGSRARLFCPNPNEKPVGEAMASLHQLFPDLQIDDAHSTPKAKL